MTVPTISISGTSSLPLLPLRKILLIGLLLGISSLFNQRANAQTPPPLWIDLNITDTRGPWAPTAHGTITVEHDGALLRLRKTTDDGPAARWSYILLDPSKDFTIDVVLRLDSTKPELPLGFVWGGNGLSDVNYVGITAAKRAAAGRYTGGSWDTRFVWGNAPQLHGVGEFDTIRVTRISDSISFFINNTLFAKHASIEFPIKGSLLGFELTGRMTTSIQRVSIRQDRPPLRLDKGRFSGKDRLRLPGSVNSPFAEKGPILSADGSSLWFTREDADQDVSDDIWVSRKGANGAFSRATRLPRPLNGNGPNYLVWMSPDEEKAVVGNIYDETAAVVDVGFSRTTKHRGTWVLPTPMEISDYKNNARSVFACMSADGNALIVSVARPGGYGSLDLWVYVRLENGNWSDAANLGPQINTFGQEVTPFLAPDGRTLFFSSSGHTGYGGNDIFMTIRLDDSWTKWTPPVNLGPSVNGPDWEGYYSESADGSLAVYCAAGPEGDLDLYAFASPQVLKRLNVEDDELHRSIDATSPGGTVRLENIFFDQGKSVLRSESEAEIHKLVEVLRSNPNMVIEIIGHTDDVGDEAANLMLSTERAGAVLDRLVELGIDPQRLRAKGYGETRPLVPNRTEANRRRNRRVEFVVISK